MARTAVRGRLNVWQIATVAAVSAETFRARTLRLAVPEWAGPGAGRHRAGQHVDVRLTAEDGYQAERAYSIASAPGEPLALTVERVDDGEVSSWLTQEARPGDLMEVRGPIGGYFVWEPAFGGPLTRSQPPAWAGYARRVDQPMLAEVAWPASSAGAGGGDGPLAYVCGPTSFVETVAAGLVALGYPAGRVRTERFGAGG